jgi:death-on-curing protein
MRRSREGCVEGAIGNAVLAAGYAAQEGDEPDILHVAAYLMRSLARLHCYTDGNKRIAWLATLDVLAVHTATTLEVDQDEAAETVVAVATGVMGIPDLCTWLAEHLVPLT